MPTQRPFLIGTAGHVDHGKTTLVQALTGVNTDRLEEERRRGMSIELGFAEFRLPGGRMAGIVDVPGHERFLKNMLAGAWGVDFGLLVVAADEGVMPQTREHLAILQALHVPAGLTAITKADTVDPEWLEMARAEVREALRGTFLAEAPIVDVDSVSGRGLAELVGYLEETAARLPEPDLSRPVFLPVDRVFHRQGFGVVVTGSLRSGVLREGDSLLVYPAGRPARVRGLQTFGLKEPEAMAGMRTAVNLSGIDADEVGRGDVLAPPGTLAPSQRMNVRLELEADARPLRHRARVRVHIGTSEILARVLLWESAEIRPDASGLAQLHLEEPAVARRGDRFVVRWYSPQDLLGGGTVLEPAALPFRAREEAVVRRLLAMESGDPAGIVREALAASAPNPVTVEAVAARTGLSAAEAEEALGAAAASGAAVETPAGFIGADALAALRNRWVKQLAQYHRKAPLRPGMPKEALRTQDAHQLASGPFDAVLGVLAREGSLVVERDVVHLPGFSVELRPDQEAAAREIDAMYAEGGWQPPGEHEVIRILGPHRATRELWEHLAASGRLVAIGEGLYLHGSVAEAGLQALRGLFASKPSVTIADFKDAVGASRRTAVPFLEWCDTKRYTRRLTDARAPGQRLG